LDSRKRFSLSPIARCRWNFLDAVHLIARKTVPTYIWADIDAGWIETLVAKYAKRGLKLPLTAIVMKAIAVAQRNHPASRSAMLPWGRTMTMNNIVGGVTVERFVGQTHAVFFGSIEAPDSKPLEEIAKELTDYAEADVSQVTQLEMQHQLTNWPWLLRQLIFRFSLRFPQTRLNLMNATFAVSSIAKYGCKLLIPPCISTSTFGIGAVEPRAVVRDGKIEVRPAFSLALNYDHRVIDGAPAARLLKDVRELLEGALNQYLPAMDNEEEAVDVQPKRPSNTGELSPIY
jgi:pyruvate/2-oxoglutarate dehydrogenase complex dihydrolipoamide acyltransferase (E2) component